LVGAADAGLGGDVQDDRADAGVGGGKGRQRTPATGAGEHDVAGLGEVGEAAAAAAKTDTFLGERSRRLVKRRGKLKALVAIARSILVIVWHLLARPR